MSVYEVKAWKTSDNKLFENEQDAIDHEKRYQNKLIKNEQWDNLKSYLESNNKVYHRSSEHWYCEKSPIKECVYEGYPEYIEECFYCGEPEERK